MAVRDAILAVLYAQEGSIEGRTMLHKKLYFLGTLSREDFGFVPYYYGPYSTTVTDCVGALVEAGFVEESVEILSEQGGRFGPVRRFSYQLSSEGKDIVHRNRAHAVGVYLELLKRINSSPIASDSTLLPVAAKVYFLVEQHGRASVPEIEKAAAGFGWEISSQQISEVVDYLRQLDLIETRKS